MDYSTLYFLQLVNVFNLAGISQLTAIRELDLTRLVYNIYFVVTGWISPGFSIRHI